MFIISRFMQLILIVSTDDIYQFDVMESPGKQYYKIKIVQQEDLGTGFST